MSDAMAICYGGQPQLEPLVQREREREVLGEKEANVNAGDLATQKSLQPTQPEHPDFPFTVYRSMEGPGDGEIELAIQVKHYRAPGNNGHLDHRDPNYEAGEIEFGDAVNIATGNTIELTRMEWASTKEAFWAQ